MSSVVIWIAPSVRGNFHRLMHVAHLKRQIDFFALPNDERDIGATVGLKSSLRRRDFVVADVQSVRVESPRFIGDQRAAAAGLEIDHCYRRARDRPRQTNR